MDESASEWLDRGVGQGLPVAVTAELDGAPRTYLGRFLQHDADTGGVWVHTLADDADKSLARAIALKPPVNVTFVREATKVTFGSAIVRREHPKWLNDRVSVDAVLLAPPQDVRAVEMRREPRVAILDHGALRARLFRLACALPRPPRGKDNAEIVGQLLNMSRGGAAFACPFDRKLLTMTAGELVLVVIEFRGRRVLVSSAARYVKEISSQSIRIGIQFVRADNAEGLEAVVQELERVAAKSKAPAVRKAS